jgi:hypothetical protein
MFVKTIRKVYRAIVGGKKTVKVHSAHVAPPAPVAPVVKPVVKPVGLSSVVKSPVDCSAAEIREFIALLGSSGTVDASGLDRLVARANKLAFLREDGKLIGIAGLKNPRKSYVKRIGAPRDTVEIGWLYISHGKRSFSKVVRLVVDLLKTVRGNLFATTKNKSIAAIAKRAGFKVVRDNDGIIVLSLDYALLQKAGSAKSIYDRWVNK